MALADELAEKAPVAMRLNKARFREVTEPGFRDAIASGIRNQREAYATGEPARMMEKFLAERAARKAAQRQGMIDAAAGFIRPFVERPKPSRTGCSRAGKAHRSRSAGCTPPLTPSPPGCGATSGPATAPPSCCTTRPRPSPSCSAWPRPASSGSR